MRRTARRARRSPRRFAHRVYLDSVVDAPAAKVDWKALGLTAPEKFKKSDLRTLPWPRYESNGAGYTYQRHAHIWTIAPDGSNAKQLTTAQTASTGLSGRRTTRGSSTG